MVRLVHLEFKNCSLSYSTDKEYLDKFSNLKSKHTSNRPSTGFLTLKDTITLRMVNLKVEPGDRIAIVGKPRASAEHLLLSVAQELEIVSGSFEINGKIFYQPRDTHFVEDTIIQNIIMGLPYVEEKYWKILRVVGLESLFKGLPSLEKTIIMNNGSELPEDLRRLIVIARMIYFDADIYLVERFFDSLPSKYKKTGLKDIMETYKDKTFVVLTDFEELVDLVDRVVVVEMNIIDSVIQCDKITQSERDNLKRYLVGPIEDHSEDMAYCPIPPVDYIEKFTQISRQRSQSQLEFMRSESFNQLLQSLRNKIYNTALYFKIDRRSDQKVTPTRTMFRFFVFNSGWFTPVILALLMISNTVLNYFFSLYVSLWKSQPNKLKFKDHLTDFIIISMITFVSAVTTSIVLVRYIRRISLKLFVYMIKGLLAHSLEFFYTVSTERLISAFNTEFTTLDEKLGMTIFTIYQQFIRLNMVFIISLYGTYYTGAGIVVVYIMIMYTLFQQSPVSRSFRSVVLANQSYLVHTVMDIHKGLRFFRNTSDIKYHEDAFYMVNDVYGNSKGHQGNIADRWVCTRVNGLVMLVPLFIIANGIVSSILGHDGKDPYERIKLTISFDLVFTIGSLTSGNINRASLQTSLDKIKELIVMDETSERRKQLGMGMVSGNSNDQRRLEVSSLVIINPITSLPMLSYVSMEVDKGEKVAIVGSRGSGRNTFIRAMMRMVDPEWILSGKITLDGKSISGIGDEEFSKSVYRLTGSYKLYEGSIKMNIDPRNEYSDEQIINALDYMGYWRLKNSGEMIQKFYPVNKKNKHTNRNAHLKEEININGSRIEQLIKVHNIREDLEDKAPSFEVTHTAITTLLNNKYQDRLKSPMRKKRQRKTDMVSKPTMKDIDPYENKEEREERMDYFQPNMVSVADLEENLDQAIDESTPAENEDYNEDLFEEVNESNDEDSEQDKDSNIVKKSFKEDEKNKSADEEAIANEEQKKKRMLRRLPSAIKKKRQLELCDDLDLRVEGCSFEEISIHDSTESEETDEDENFLDKAQRKYYNEKGRRVSFDIKRTA